MAVELMQLGLALLTLLAASLLGLLAFGRRGMLRLFATDHGEADERAPPSDAAATLRELRLRRFEALVPAKAGNARSRTPPAEAQVAETRAEVRAKALAPAQADNARTRTPPAEAQVAEARAEVAAAGVRADARLAAAAPSPPAARAPAPALESLRAAALHILQIVPTGAPPLPGQGWLAEASLGLAGPALSLDDPEALVRACARALRESARAAGGSESHITRGGQAVSAFAAASFARLGVHPLFRAGAGSDDESARALGRLRRALAAEWAEGVLAQADGTLPAAWDAVRLRGGRRLHPLLLAIDPRAASPLPVSLLGLAAEALPAETLCRLVRPCARRLAADARDANLTDGERLQLPFWCLVQLCSHPAIGAAIAGHEHWLGEAEPPTAASLQGSSVLGPFLLPSALPSACAAVGEAAFPDVLRMQPRDAEHALRALRAQCAQLSAQLGAAAKSLLRADGGRRAFLRFVGAALKLSEERRLPAYDPSAACSDGALCNLSALLLGLAAPLCTGGAGGAPDGAKLASVRASFCAAGGNEFLPLHAEPRMRAAGGAAAEARGAAAEAAEAAPSFVCCLFWLSARCLHVGLLPTWRHYAQLLADLGRAHRRLRELRELRDRTGALGGVLAPQVSACESELGVLLRAKYCVDVHLLDPAALHGSAAFYAAAACWLSAQIERGEAEPGAGAACLSDVPLFLAQGLAEWLSHAARFAPEVLLPTWEGAVAIDAIAALCARLLGRPELCGCARTRLCMLEALWHLAPVEGNPHLAQLSGRPRAYERNAGLHALLPAALCALHVNSEHARAAEAYGHEPGLAARHMALSLLHHALAITHADAAAAGVPPPAEAGGAGPYGAALSRLECGLFARFARRLLTDLALALTAAAERAPAHAAHEAAVADAAAWAALLHPVRLEREAVARNAAAHLRRDLQLAHGAARSLRAISQLRAADFARAAAPGGCAPAMLSYALGLLCGPRLARAGGGASDGEQRQPRPVELLADVLGACAALGGGGGREADGAEAGGGAGEARAMLGLDPSLLRTAAALCGSRLTPAEAAALRGLARAPESQLGSEELCACPDEFLCPLSAALIDDPVRLPSSRMIVDRAAILGLLQDEPSDPFTRESLQPDELEPNEELRARIASWRADRAATRSPRQP